MTPKLRWTLAIVGLLLVNVVASCLLLAYATNGDTRVVPAHEVR